MHVTREELKRGRNVFTPQEMVERKMLEDPDIPEEVKDELVARAIREIQSTWNEQDRLRATTRCSGVTPFGSVIPTIRDTVLVRRPSRQ